MRQDNSFKRFPNNKLSVAEVGKHENQSIWLNFH